MGSVPGRLAVSAENGGGGNRTRVVFRHDWLEHTHLSPKSMRWWLLQRDGPGCFYCGREIETDLYQRDHVIPKSRGGSDLIGNRVLACAPCNYEKMTHPGWLYVLLRELGRPVPRRLPGPPMPSFAADWARGDWVRELAARVGEIRYEDEDEAAA